MSSGRDSYLDDYKDQVFYEKQAKIKDSGLPYDVYCRIEDLESLANKNRSQYSYEFGLKLNAIVNNLKEYL